MCCEAAEILVPVQSFMTTETAVVDTPVRSATSAIATLVCLSWSVRLTVPRLDDADSFVALRWSEVETPTRWRCRSHDRVKTIPVSTTSMHMLLVVAREDSRARPGSRRRPGSR